MPKKALTTKTNKLELKFTKEFSQNINGELKTGSDVTILFDSERIPFERSTNEKGKAEWSISAFAQFSPEGAVNEIKLSPVKKGKSADSILKGEFTVPTESNEAVIWFLNTGKSGNVYFDSAFGYNYRFPVVAEVVETPVTPPKARPQKA